MDLLETVAAEEAGTRGMAAAAEEEVLIKIDLGTVAMEVAMAEIHTTMVGGIATTFPAEEVGATETVVVTPTTGVVVGVGGMATMVDSTMIVAEGVGVLVTTMGEDGSTTIGQRRHETEREIAGQQETTIGRLETETTGQRAANGPKRKRWRRGGGLGPGQGLAIANERRSPTGRIGHEDEARHTRKQSLVWLCVFVHNPWFYGIVASTNTFIIILKTLALLVIVYLHINCG